MNFTRCSVMAHHKTSSIFKKIKMDLFSGLSHYDFRTGGSEKPSV